MSVWVVFVLMIGVAAGWLVAFPLGRQAGYHDGYTDASIDAERQAYLEQFDRERRFRTTPDVVSRITRDIKEHHR